MRSPFPRRRSSRRTGDRSRPARTAAEEGLELARQSGLKQAGQFNLSALGFLELSLGNAEATDRLLRPLAEGVLEAGIGEPGHAAVPAR